MDGKFVPVLWSSMRSINAEPISVLLSEKFGLKFDKVYSQGSCEPNLSKNLKVVAKDYQVDVSEVFLVDDSLRKRIDDQNFIEIKTFDGTDEKDE